MKERKLKDLTIGDYLKMKIDDLKISQTQFAKCLGVPNNRINEIINGKRELTLDTDIRLSKFYNIPVGHFLKMQLDIIIRNNEANSKSVNMNVITLEELKKRNKLVSNS